MLKHNYIQMHSNNRELSEGAASGVQAPTCCLL